MEREGNKNVIVEGKKSDHKKATQFQCQNQN